MKNITFLLDLTVYSIQIVSLLLTFITFLKFRNSTLKYYVIILLVTLLDNIANSIRDFLTIAASPGKPVFIAINYFSSILLMLWFFYSARMVHSLTGRKISRPRRVLIAAVSIYPVFYVISDMFFYGFLGYMPSENPFSFCVISTQLLRCFYIFIFLYMAAVLFFNRKAVSGKEESKIAAAGIIFSVLFIPALIIDLYHILHGFYMYFIPLTAWNIMNIAYLMKNIYSRKFQDKENISEKTSGENKTEESKQINGIISVKHEDSYIFLKFEDIISVKALNKRTVLKTKNSSYVTYYTLSEIEDKSSGRLIRVHRNSLINPDHIKQVEKYFGGTYAAIMDNSDVVEMSRRISSDFRKTYLK